MKDYIPFNWYESHNIQKDNSVLCWINDMFKRHADALTSSIKMLSPETDIFCLEDVAMESFRQTFRAGYCWNFTHMLKDTFNRGKVCWAAPFSHFVWIDDDGTAYDCEGITESEVDHFIPEDYIPDEIIQGFKHVSSKPGKIAEKEYLEAIITKYLVSEL